MFDYRAVNHPYPGLRPFEPWETSIFFGRDIHIDRLQDILKSRHFLTVTGPSGSGKSSLVRAGLLPALPLGAIGTGTGWRAVIMRPGDKPISSLAKELSDRYALGPELERIEASANSTPTATRSTLEAELRRGPLGLADLVGDLRQHAGDPDFNLLILVDQFEEIFTYAEAGIDQADESEAFVNLLLAASKNQNARIFVVITMRTDFLGACTRFQDLPDEINRSLYLTPRLNREQLTQAIAGPAALYKLELSKELVAEYVNASQNEPDQLPVLQHALARRWDQSLQAAPNEANEDIFQSVSNLGQALSEHADTVYQTLTDEQRLNAQWLFRAITEQRAAETGGQMVRRPRSLELIAKWCGQPWQAFLPILTAFADPKVNFLTYKGQPGEPEKAEKTVIDISHEAVMRQWIGLKNWIGSEGKAAQEYNEWRQRAVRKDSGDGSYLSGADLSRAEVWLKQGLDFAPPSAQAPAPHSAPSAEWASRYSQDNDSDKSFAQVTAFIQQSRNASLFSKRLAYSLAAFLIMACFSAAWLGYNSYQQTIQSAAKSLWLPFNAGTDLTHGDGANALGKVAKADDNVRRRFIEGILYDENIANAFSSNPALFLRASIQSDLNLREQLLEQLRKDTYKKDSKPLAHARIQALLELDASAGMRQLLHHSSTTGDFDLIRALTVEKLQSYTARLDENQAAHLVTQYVEAIGKTTDTYGLNALGSGLVALSDKLDGNQAARAVIQYVEAIGKTADPDRLRALGEGLASLPDKFDDRIVQSIAAVLPLQPFDRLTGAQQSSLAMFINAIIPRLTPSSKDQAKSRLKLVEIPFVDPEAIAKSIRRFYTAAPGEKQGVWAFLTWANGYFGMNRPDSEALTAAVLEILLLPLLILSGGGWLLQVLTGRELVALRLKNRLPNRQDRRGLGLRIQGYTVEQVKIHWGVLSADERMIEQRFLIGDLIFVLFYSGIFLYALLLACGYLSEPLPSPWLVALVCAMALADWIETAIQFQQLKRLDRKNGHLQKNWIRLASVATQIKLLSIVTAIIVLSYFTVQLVMF